MDDWDDLIANAISEEYYAANVVIDGESYKNVGIRAKGNTSAYFLTLDTTKIEAAQFGWGSFGLLNYIAGDLHCF